MRRTTPFSDDHGFDRGSPIDRYYIERFLAQHRADIRGHVLEAGDRRYTERYGSGVRQSDILDVTPTNPLATIVADLTAANAIPGDQFDCFVLTQTLHLVYDVPAALRHAHRILRPGGVLLATAPAIGRIANPSDGTTYWRFTNASCARLFSEAFGAENVTVASHGSVLTCVTHLLGLAYEEIGPAELAFEDPRFPVVVTVRAVKQ